MSCSNKSIFLYETSELLDYQHDLRLHRPLSSRKNLLVLESLSGATPQHQNKNCCVDIGWTAEISCHRLMYDGHITPVFPHKYSCCVKIHTLNTKISYTMHSTDPYLGYIGVGIEHLPQS